MPTDIVEFLKSGVVITSSPPKKVVVYLQTFDAGLRLPLTNYQEELLCRNGSNVQMLTPSTVHKMVAFEMIGWANGIVPNSSSSYSSSNLHPLMISTPYLLVVETTTLSLTANRRRTGKTSGCELIRNCLDGSAAEQMPCLMLPPSCIPITR